MQDQLVAVHPRCYERGQDILELNHYLDVLERKPYALNHAKAFRDAGLPDIYHQYLAGLRQRNDKANLEFVKLLKLRANRDPEVVDEILKLAIECSIYHYDGIKALWDGMYSEEQQPGNISWKQDEYQIAPPNLSCFDQLLGGGAA